MLITERTAESMTVFMRSIADAELFIDDLKANFAGGAFQADLESNALLVSDSRAAGVRGVKVTVASSDSTRLDSEIVGFIRSRSAY